VFAVEKIVTSKLYEKGANRWVLNFNPPSPLAVVKTSEI